MARLFGVDLPREKRIEIGLTYIYGIGNTTAKKIIAETGVNPDIRVKDISEDDLQKIREYIDKNLTVEGDLHREVSQNIKRLMEIGCYRGLRHRKGLPVRGQRTHTNARTRKAPTLRLSCSQCLHSRFRLHGSGRPPLYRQSPSSPSVSKQSLMSSMRFRTSTSSLPRRSPTSSAKRATKANAAVKLESICEFNATLKKTTLRPIRALRAATSPITTTVTPRSSNTSTSRAKKGGRRPTPTMTATSSDE